MQSAVSGIAVAPNGDLWLAGSSPNSIYRSKDNGATWSSAISGPSGQSKISGIAVGRHIVPLFTDNTGDGQAWTKDTAITQVTIPRAKGVPAPTYTMSSVPAGIDVVLPTKDADGSISGTPTATGSGTITITATNSVGSGTWTIAYNTAPSISAPSFSDATGDDQAWTENTAIANVVVPEAAGIPSPTYAVEGSLPAGLAFDTERGQFRARLLPLGPVRLLLGQRTLVV